MAETSADVVKRYLQDAIAGEKSIQTHLADMAEDKLASSTKQLFSDCAQISRSHQERLTARLSSLGGSLPGAKGLFAHIFATSPKSTSIAHHGISRLGQDVIETLTVGHNQLAVYEALAIIAEAGGDSDTAASARGLQSEERAMLEQLLSSVATSAARLSPLP